MVLGSALKPESKLSETIWKWKKRFFRRNPGRDCGSPVIPVSVLPRPSGWKEQNHVLLLLNIAMIQINARHHFQWPMLETFPLHWNRTLAQLSCFASLPPTPGEEGGGNPRSCSRRSETDAPLMQAGPHAGMILRTQSMPIDMGNKFFIWRNGPNIKDDISHYQESCLLCWQLAFISQQRLASTDLSSFPSWKGRFIKRNSVGISVEFGLSGG